MGSIGGWELLLIFLVVLLVFGAKRIPEIARGLGKGIREFKDATTNIKSELNMDDERRINSPRQGSSMPRQDAYQQPTSAPTYQEQAPPPQQAAPPPSQPSEQQQKTHSGE